jgi:hypothetical protein
LAGHCRTFHLQFAAGALKFDHHDLSAGEGSAPALAAKFVIEGIPEMEFVEITQCVEFVFGVELEPRVSVHTSYIHNVAKRSQWVSKLLLAYVESRVRLAQELNVPHRGNDRSSKSLVEGET